MSKYPRIAGVNYESMADGEGMRAVIFFSGCPHRCLGCQNKEAQLPSFGTEVTDEMIKNIANEIVKRPFIKGITLSGGDPLFDVKKTAEFVLRLYSELIQTTSAYVLDDIWMYTGYTWEELVKRYKQDNLLWAFLSIIHVIVDGRFNFAIADKRLVFRGSSNQRIIDVSASMQEDKAVLYME